MPIGSPPFQIVPLPLPNQIAAGQLASAAPVMSNFNYIADQINLNAQPIANTSVVLIQWATGASIVSATQYVIGAAWTPTVLQDTLTEFDTSTGEFLAGNAGTYLAQVAVPISSSAASVSNINTAYFYKNFGSVPVIVGVCFLVPPAFGTSPIQLIGSCIVQLAVGETLSCVFNAPTFASGAMQTAVVGAATNALYSICRI